MNKNQLKRIVSAKRVAKIAKELGLKPAKLHNIRYCYGQIVKGNDNEAKKRQTKLYPLLKELANEPHVSVSHVVNNEPHVHVVNDVSTSTPGKVELPDFDFDQLDKLVDDFKLNLASVMATLIKKIVAKETETVIERNRNKWKAEGALEEQAKFIEAGKKTNLAEMLKNRLMGEK